ncbi:hypothetical protein EJ04DRAFT_439136 [Polyplosphaeria fusca]|uniref:Uncharacterized protein n=1 Tax=Polyplosphaeria fusca TaxID=682080 RepID=A0A9P4QYG8_9PLEO|nr:hypothetical protein EJ04DRAFT_439136 [Polyplosphaeria fusca]
MEPSDNAGWSAAGQQFSAQWTEPGDIFSVLLIIGGDVVKLALAAVAGGSRITPVAFSFGWVAYAISAVVSAISDNKLINCPPEANVQVFNLRSGYSRSNQSWLLARLVKTYPFWMPKEVRSLVQPTSIKRRSWYRTVPPPRIALCVAIYRWREDIKPGEPSHDLVWWSGFAVTLVQLGLAAVPMGLHSDYAVFLTTVAGTILAYLSASLPQWRAEKWHARRTPKDVALTLGNGQQHVIIVRGSTASEGVALDLEDLASGLAPDMLSTRVATTVMAVLWLALLLTCTGINIHTWYLVGVGGIGMLHNIVVAGAPRMPEAMGLPIELVREGRDVGEESAEGRGEAVIFSEPKVMWTLMELERRYKGYGRALLPEFFPGSLRSWEEEWWNPSTSVEKRKELLQKGRLDEQRKQAARSS